MQVLKFILTAFLILFVSISLAYTEKTIQIQVSQHQSQFSIQLKSNPSTGYQWQLCEDNNKKEVILVSHAYHAPTHALIGAPGFEKWVFKKVSAESGLPKKTSLCFIYVRPWEPQPVKKIVFEIVPSA